MHIKVTKIERSASLGTPGILYKNGHSPMKLAKIILSVIYTGLSSRVNVTGRINLYGTVITSQCNWSYKFIRDCHK